MMVACPAAEAWTVQRQTGVVGMVSCRRAACLAVTHGMSKIWRHGGPRHLADAIRDEALRHDLPKPTGNLQSHTGLQPQREWFQARGILLCGQLTCRYSLGRYGERCTVMPLRCRSSWRTSTPTRIVFTLRLKVGRLHDDMRKRHVNLLSFHLA
jgi:hypothetical protein